MTRFQTNKLLWLVLTLTLWIPTWFIWHIGKAGDTDTPLTIVWEMLRQFVQNGLSFGRLEEFFGFIIFFFVIPLLAAATVAWVIHCPIVMFMHRPKNDEVTTDH